MKFKLLPWTEKSTNIMRNVPREMSHDFACVCVVCICIYMLCGCVVCVYLWCVVCVWRVGERVRHLLSTMVPEAHQMFMFLAKNALVSWSTVWLCGQVVWKEAPEKGSYRLITKHSILQFQWAELQCICSYLQYLWAHLKKKSLAFYFSSISKSSMRQPEVGFERMSSQQLLRGTALQSPPES